MEWVMANWFFILFAALFIGMHLFGYGCCGHGKHGGDEGHDEYKHSGEGTSEKKEGGSCH